MLANVFFWFVYIYFLHSIAIKCLLFFFVPNLPSTDTYEEGKKTVCVSFDVTSIVVIMQ